MSDENKSNSDWTTQLFSLTGILRLCVSGGVFLLAFLYTSDPSSPWENLKKCTENQLMITGLVPLIGILLYSFNRAVPGALVQFARFKFFDKWPHFRSFFISEKVARRMRRGWVIAHGAKSFHSHIVDWSHYVQVLYCSAWGVLFGSWCAVWTDRSWAGVSAQVCPSPQIFFVGWNFDMLLASIFIALFLSALVSDCRRSVVEDWLYRIDDKIQKLCDPDYQIEDPDSYPFGVSKPWSHSIYKDNLLAETTPLIPKKVPSI